MSANMTNTRVKNPIAIIELYLREKRFLSFYGEVMWMVVIIFFRSHVVLQYNSMKCAFDEM